MPNKLELVVGASKLLAETSAGKATVETAAALLEEVTPGPVKTALTSSFNEFEQLITDAWRAAPYKEAAGQMARDFAEGKALKSSGVGSFWSQLRAEKDSKFGEVPPVLSAMVKSDAEIYSQPVRNWAPYLDTNKLAQLTGVDKSVIRFDSKSGQLQIKVPQEAIAHISTEASLVTPPMSQIGVTDGSLTDRLAVDAIWKRYVSELRSSTLEPFPATPYPETELRKIERHFGLPDQSFHYKDSSLTFSPPKQFAFRATPSTTTGMSEAATSNPQTSVPYESRLTHAPDHQINFALNGDNFQLIPRGQVFLWRYSRGWRGADTSLSSDFKLRIIADSGDDLGRIHDVFLPLLHKDPEFKDLLTNWKIINPTYRKQEEALSGQRSKAITLYPAGDEKLLRLYEKLDGIIRNQAPDLILPAPPATNTVDRLLGSTNRVAVAREHFSSDSSGLVSLNRVVSHRFKHDKELGPFSPKSRLRALEEATGIEFGALHFAENNELAVQGIAKEPGKAYVGEGHSERRSRVSSGYTARWAMHMVGARYDCDPLLIRKLRWKF